MHSVLSPLAPAFQPIEFAIFNDGVPSSVFYGSHPEHEVISHIEDEALDETFPPDASDVSGFSYFMYLYAHNCNVLGPFNVHMH